MKNYKSNFINTIISRGFMHQCTNLEALDDLASKSAVTAYIGFDCTGNSLHAGSLMQIMMLRWLQKTGHKPIVLIGGGTTKIGDPSGKDQTRKLLDDEQIKTNMDGIKRSFSNYLKFGGGPTDAIMINNDEWLNGIEYISFLRDYGRHFSVNRMLGFDSVKLRLEREQPLTFLEFNYMILQAYDFLELSRRNNCIFQIGGSDQWGNIVNGVELARRVDNKSLYGLTTPLLETSSGAKMGKTSDGAIWLNDDLLSSYDYWQFWRNTEDDDIGRFLRLFTELPEDEISRLENLKGSELNEAKKILATEVTELCHGKNTGQQAAKTARQTFEEGGIGEKLPSINENSKILESGIPVCKLFCKAGLAKSNGDARRLIKGGGGKINDKKIGDFSYIVSTEDINTDGFIKLSAGKKRHVLVRVS